MLWEFASRTQTVIFFGMVCCDVQPRQVAGRHSIHSYYVANLESPDGKHVLFFTSKHPASYVGEVRILERATGKETVLAENVHTEDAHSVACQQWLSGGKRVAAPNFTPAHVRTFQTHPHPVTEDGR